MIEIIPAIDLIEGKCVRLAQGDFAQKTVYAENPLEVAKQFEAVGVRRLHVVDLDGAKTGKIVNLPVLETIANNTNLTIDFGGGVKTIADAHAVFDAGAAILTVGSLAVKQPELLTEWLAKFGGDKILLGTDAKNGKIAINGWQTATELELIPFLKSWTEKGATQVFCTDISRDGLLQGAAIDLYREIKTALPDLILIASGGVSDLSDLEALENAGCWGAIVGKAIYENRISLEQIGEYAKNAG